MHLSVETPRFHRQLARCAHGVSGPIAPSSTPSLAMPSVDPCVFSLFLPPNPSHFYRLVDRSRRLRRCGPNGGRSGCGGSSGVGGRCGNVSFLFVRGALSGAGGIVALEIGALRLAVPRRAAQRLRPSCCHVRARSFNVTRSRPFLISALSLNRSTHTSCSPSFLQGRDNNRHVVELAVPTLGWRCLRRAGA